MPTARLEGHRIRLGTHTVAALTSSYALSNETAFPLQTDQDPFATPWIVRGRETLPPARARSVEALDNTTIEDGFWLFQWSFSYFTFDMLKYWNGTLLGGAASAAVTVMTYDQNDEAVYLTCKTSKIAIPRDAAYHPGGWRDVTVKFREGTVIT